MAASLAALLLTFLPAHAVAREGVVATENPQAVAAGARILREGGGAVDAAIASALAVCTVHPSSCGIGGGGFLVVWDAARRESSALDFREQAPAAISEGLYEEDGTYQPARSRRGGLASGVPGEIRGFAEAHARFGKLPWAALFAPAIELAREGFVVSPHLAKRIAAVREGIAADAALAPVFLDDDGEPPAAGTRLRRPQLAATFEEIANRGPDAFYEGEIADAIVAASRSRGGVFTARDLAEYRPLWRSPLKTRYRGAEIATMPPPSSGGIALITALDTLAEYDLSSFGPDSPTRWHLYAEILKHAFAWRAQSAGDPGWDEPLWPPRGPALRDRIRSYETLPSSAYEPIAPPPSDAGTAHVSVIAPDGSAAALTTTINTTFGSLVGVPGTGIILNNEMDDFTFDAPNLFGLAPGPTNRIAPRKRPASSMTPTLAIRDGRAVVAVGASGGPLIISATIEVLTNVLDFGLPPEAAVAAPRVHHQWMPDVLLVESGVRPIDQRALEILGHEVREFPGIASVSLATATSEGKATGAGDPRKGGTAETVSASR